MRIGSLCSGYGGLDLAVAAHYGMSVAWHAEFDKHASRVLELRFPGVPNHGDITTTDWTQVEPIDVLTAGLSLPAVLTRGEAEGQQG